jgi:hypothetical protein
VLEVNIYGVFRSGTNYVKALLDLNYTMWVRTRNGGFKHAPIPALFDQSGWVARESIGVVRDPWAWLPSMWDYAPGPGNYNVTCASSWDAFLVEPLEIYSGALAGFPRYWYRTPVDYWTAMVASFKAKSTVVVKYEDALAHPEKTCDGVAGEYGASRLRAEFLVPRRTMRRASDDRFESMADATSEQVFDREYYEHGRYMDRYSSSNIEAVNKLLIDDIVGPLGYAKVT